MSFKRKKNGIIICTTEYITNKQYGGLAVFLEKFIKTLKQKYEINLIVSSKSNKSKNYKNIKIHYVNTDSFYHKLFKKYLNWFFCILQSYIINKKVNNVIYKNKNIKFVHFSNYQFIGLFYKNSLPSITRLSSLETLWEPENFLSIKSKLEKYTLSRSDIIFSPSYFLIKELKKVYKLKSYFLPPIIEYNNIRKKK